MSGTLVVADFVVGASHAGSNSGVGWARKKVRRRLDVLPDIKDPIVDENERQIPVATMAKASYKATLMGSSTFFDVNASKNNGIQRRVEKECYRPWMIVERRHGGMVEVWETRVDDNNFVEVMILTLVAMMRICIDFVVFPLAIYASPQPMQRRLLWHFLDSIAKIVEEL
ncbi:hypothetical protein J1N35_023047 [Gossypium stocksii]|uniref:Uncharacterized protein n=1 Tax=Gossypium stocksii TaxID=47602 RepID=A0A9D4A1Q6_9ROSI|nr:hypothetical protein J1N35_023047 [Gossypium stocksii]